MCQLLSLLMMPGTRYSTYCKTWVAMCKSLIKKKFQKTQCMFFFVLYSKLQSFIKKKMIDYEYESLIFLEYADNRTIDI